MEPSAYILEETNQRDIDEVFGKRESRNKSVTKKRENQKK